MIPCCLTVGLFLSCSFGVITPIELLLDNEPIDVVYTWVNGSEERFQTQLKHYIGTSIIMEDINGPSRFSDKDELKYSLRALEKYMPWYRHLFIVTNGQVPYWLNLQSQRLTIVQHRDIFDEGILPTFSAAAIEVNLHKIPGLAKHFIYFNDDLILGRPVSLEAFYTPADGYKLNREKFGIPECHSRCPWSKLHDGVCDDECNYIECQLDGGDCGLFENDQEGEDDAYKASIISTNHALNARFGYRKRRTLPHVPLLINKEILEMTMRLFQDECFRTAARRFRHGNNIQFQLLYTYSLAEHQGNTSNIRYTFNEFQKPYTYAYVQLETNYQEMRRVFERLRRRPAQFMCFNDDLQRGGVADSADTDGHDTELVNRNVCAEMLKFFNALFPKPSSYELPSGEVNAFVYLDDIVEGMPLTINTNKNRFTSWTSWLLVVLVAVLMWYIKRKNFVVCYKRGGYL